MKRLISGLTSLAMMASIAVGSIASVSAAGDYTYSFETAFGENTKTITTEEVEAGDVTVPIKVRIYNDPGTCAINFALEMNKAAEDAGFTIENTKATEYTSGMYEIRGQSMFMNGAYVWLSSGNAEDQVANEGEEYSLISFDVVVPQGTPEGTYTIGMSEYIYRGGQYEDRAFLSVSNDENGMPVYTYLDPVIKEATIIVGKGGETTSEPEDTSETTKEPPISGKTVDYTIETVELTRDQLAALDKDGDGVAQVPVKVMVFNDPGTNGIHMKVAVDPAFTINKIDMGDAYPDEAVNDLVVFEPSNGFYLWAGLDDTTYAPVNMFAADGSAIAVYTINVPVDSEAGEYPISFAPINQKYFIDVADVDGNYLTVNTTDGAIIIEDDEETTTSEPTDTEPTDTEPTDTAPVETTIVISVETTIVISEVEVPGETTIVISEVEVPGETTIVISEVEVPGETTIVISEVEVPGETTIVISEVEVPGETTIVISEVEVPGETTIVYITVTEDTSDSTPPVTSDIEYAVDGRLFYWADEAAFDFEVLADEEAITNYTLDAATPGEAFDANGGWGDNIPVNVIVDGKVVATIKVQIALRGDADLNNSVEALDASIVLEAAVASALGKDSGLNDFQLFVANVDQNIVAGNYDVEFAVETLDASYILEYSTKNALKPGSADWNKIIK